VTDGIIDPGDASRIGEAVGEDLAADFAKFMTERVGSVLIFAADQGGNEGLAAAKAAVVEMLRGAANALESA